MAEALITYRGTLYPWQCDHVGHMNVMWYAGKFDEATWQVFREVGLTPTFLSEAGRGMAAVDQHITYAQELHAGDTVTVKSKVVEVKPRLLVFQHEMWNDEKSAVAATTTLKAVHLDTTARKSCALPDAVMQRAAAWAAGQLSFD